MNKFSHSTRQKRICTGAVLLAAVLAVLGAGVWLYRSSHRDYSAHMAFGCDALRYEQEAEIGFLSVRSSAAGQERVIRIRVEDSALQERLQGTDLKGIIGVAAKLAIPFETLQSLHLDTERIDPFAVLGMEEMADRLVLVDIHETG